MDTRTKGWEEAGRNRDGAMEGFGPASSQPFW